MGFDELSTKNTVDDNTDCRYIESPFNEL